MRISDWSSDVCSSDLLDLAAARLPRGFAIGAVVDDKGDARGSRLRKIGRGDLPGDEGLFIQLLEHACILWPQPGWRPYRGRGPGWTWRDGRGPQQHSKLNICQAENHPTVNGTTKGVTGR